MLFDHWVMTCNMIGCSLCPHALFLQAQSHLVNPSPVPLTVRKNINVAQFNQLDNISGSINAVDVQCGNNDDPPLTVCSTYTESLVRYGRVKWCKLNLSKPQQQQLHILLFGYSDVFATNNSNLGRTSLLQHTVQTGDSPPVRQHTRRIPHYQWDEVKNSRNLMLTKNHRQALGPPQ